VIKNDLALNQHEVKTMSLFRRISATLVSRIDQVVGEIENHDAVIQVALDDMRKKIAEARVRLNQVQRDSVRLGEQMTEQRHNAERWRQRAVESADADESKALECVRRARRCDMQAGRLKEAMGQYEQTAKRLAQDLSTSEQRLQSLRQKQTLMRARQSTGTALNATTETGSDALRQLDESFDRWEIKLGQLEMSVEPQEMVDPLENDFITREQEAEIRDELAALLNRENRQ
jgi:phage shock protein A